MGLITWMVGKLQTHPVYVKDPYKVKRLQEQRTQEWIDNHPYEYMQYQRELERQKYWQKIEDKKAAKAAEEEYEAFLSTKQQHDQEVFNLNKQALIQLNDKVEEIKTKLSSLKLDSMNENLKNMEIIQSELHIALNSNSLVSIAENNDDRWTEMVNTAEKDIQTAEAKLDKQKAELNSGKNIANNDPQKAEKLAKIAKLQRELDELKGEVSEDFEPEIVDKNN